MENFGPTEHQRQALLNGAGAAKVALIYHLKVADWDAYDLWQEKTGNRRESRRLFRVKVDPAPREGMAIDEIVIDEHASSQGALEFLSSYGQELNNCCDDVVILAVKPEAAVTFRIVRIISWLLRLFRGATDRGEPTATWKALNTAVWPDERQMEVARKQNPDEPLFVYNLNKYKPIADYQPPLASKKKVSGQEAYDRYAKIAGFELLRRGAFPVYGGAPICLLIGESDCMLADRWDHFIFVRYPRRRDLFSIIESADFENGEHHRDAGLERATIFMAKGA